MEYGDTIISKSNSTMTVGILVQNNSLYEIDLSLTRSISWRSRQGWLRRLSLMLFRRRHIRDQLWVSHLFQRSYHESSPIVPRSFSCSLELISLRATTASVEVITAEKDNAVLMNAIATTLPKILLVRAFVSGVPSSQSLVSRSRRGRVDADKIAITSSMFLSRLLRSLCFFQSYFDDLSTDDDGRSHGCHEDRDQ